MQNLIDLIKLLPAEYVPIFIGIGFGVYVTMQVRKPGSKQQPIVVTDPHAEWRTAVDDRLRRSNHDIEAINRKCQMICEDQMRYAKDHTERFDRLESRLDDVLKGSAHR